MCFAKPAVLSQVLRSLCHSAISNLRRSTRQTHPQAHTPQFLFAQSSRGGHPVSRSRQTLFTSQVAGSQSCNSTKEHNRNYQPAQAPETLIRSSKQLVTLVTLPNVIGVMRTYARVISIIHMKRHKHHRRLKNRPSLSHQRAKRVEGEGQWVVASRLSKINMSPVRHGA
jgi:hypothetical protein